MQNEIIKIGTAAKWRGPYNDGSTYYGENQVTMCGCLFSCKVEKVTGKPPVMVVDQERGFIALANTDVWDVLVDSINFYNRALNGVPFDTTPTEYSSNGVTSGAVFEAMKSLAESINTAFGNQMNTFTEQVNTQLGKMQSNIDKKIIEKGVYLTEDEYDALVAEDKIDPNQTYYIYEE